MMKKRMLSMLLAIVMVVGVLPGFAITASAEDTVSNTFSIDWSGACDQSNTDTVDIGSLLPDDVKITSMQVTTSRLLSSVSPGWTANSNEATLTFVTRELTEPASDKVVLTITTSNHGTFTITINITLTGKYIVNISALPLDALYDGNPHSGYSDLTGTLTSGDTYEGSYICTYATADGTSLNSAPAEIGNYQVTIAVPDDNTEYKGSLTLSFSIMGEAEASYQTEANGEWKDGAFTEALFNVYEGGTVKLLKDVALTHTATATKKMTLTSYDAEQPCVITSTTEQHGYLLRLNADVTMENVIVDGGSENDITASRALVAVGDGTNSGKLTLGDGAVVRNNNNTTENGAGGGICVILGELLIDGGQITNNCACWGGGLAIVNEDSIATLKNGVISGNKSTDSNTSNSSGGGGVYLGSGIFQMTGGEVKNNEASRYGGGIYVYAESANFELQAGTISENSAFTGGGAFLNSGITDITGGTITQNAATNFAGGVEISPYATANISGSPVIKENTSGEETNGGIYPDGFIDNNTKLYPVLTIGALSDSAEIHCYTWLERDNLEFASASDGYTITNYDLSKLTYENTEYGLLISNDDLILKSSWQSVTNVSLNKTELELLTEESEQLSASVVPENASNTDVLWSSSDNNVVTVDENGVVTAATVGTAVITVTTVDGGHTATCQVTVTALHEHSWTYRVSGSTITAICSNADGNCSNTEGGSMTISAPAHTKYGDEKDANAVLSSATVGDVTVDASNIRYQKQTGTDIWSEATATVPTDAGTYKASIEIDGAVAYVIYIVDKADQSSPAAPTGTSTGTTITLTAQTGCEYSIDGEKWQTETTFENLTPATAYTVYARLAGDDNHNPSPASTTIITTKITEAIVTITPPVKNGTPTDTVELADDAKYAASAITWTPSVADKFLGETQYTVTFTLSPEDGYVFTESAAVKVNSQDATSVANADGTLTVTYTFPATSDKAIVKFTGVKTVPTNEQTYGEAFNPDGLVVTVEYDDGTTGELAYDDSNSEWFAFSSETVLTNTIDVRYAADTGDDVSISLIVNQKPITITASRQDIAYGENIVSSVDKVTVDTLADGDTLDAITLTASTTAVTTTGAVVPSGAKIVNAAGEDVTNFYDITYVGGQLTIGLVFSHIEIIVQPKLNYTEGDKLDLSAMVVAAHYTDGSTAQLAYTDVTASIAHGTTLTTNDNGASVTVSYNGKTAETDAITVRQKQSDYNNDYWYWSLMLLYNQEFDIAAKTTEGGTITPAGVSIVKYSKSIAYTITPDEGYAIADVIVDGKSVGAVSEYTFKNVKEDHTILAVFERTAWQNPFVDISESDWYYEDIEFVYENGLMIGTNTEGTRFSPDATLNRAMLVTILWRMEGEPIVNSPVDFFDVHADEWYSEAIDWASANGIVLGYGDSTFGPMNELTREQLATILYRYEQYKGGGFVGAWMFRIDYEDLAEVSDWAYEAVCWMTMHDIYVLREEERLDPGEEATRAETAAFLHRYCEQKK